MRRLCRALQVIEGGASSVVCNRLHALRLLPTDPSILRSGIQVKQTGVATDYSNGL